MSFIDDNATAVVALCVTIIALLGAKLYDYKTRLDAAEAKAGDYDALNRRLTEAKSLYYQRERTVAMAQKELVESARKRKVAEAKAEKLLQERDAARELSKDFAATTRVVAAMETTTARMSRELEEAARNQKKAEAAVHKLRQERDGKATAERELQSKLDAAQSRVESEASRAEATIEEYKEALKLAAAGEVEKMRDELECMREELEEAKRDRELAINCAGGAADDVAKAAGEAAAAERERAAAARAELEKVNEAAARRIDRTESLNIRLRDRTGEETFFKIKKTTKMFKVFNAWCTWRVW